MDSTVEGLENRKGAKKNDMRKKKVFLIIFLVLALSAGAIGGIYVWRGSVNASQQQEIADIAKQLRVAEVVCWQFDLPAIAIYPDDITKAQIIMQPGTHGLRKTIFL
jgi:hypothetical protein